MIPKLFFKIIVVNYLIVLWYLTIYRAFGSCKHLFRAGHFFSGEKKELRSGQKHTQLLQDEDSVSCSTISPWFHDLREFKFIVANDTSTLISALNFSQVRKK